MSEGNGASAERRRRNWLLLLGMLLLTVGLVGGVFLLALEVMLDAAPYLGALYLLFALLVVGGFVTTLLGMLNGKAPGVHESLAQRLRFTFDPTRRSHVYGAATVAVFGVLLFGLLGFGSYKSFLATESPSFCGELCHSVMHPEWTTYQTSSHARVSCVECHIGEGADWFVRSKIDGLRQVWAVAVNSYARPIPTPIHNLRPARETCEECHWPQKFIGYKELVRSYFLGDEENSPHRLRMLLKIGGEQTGFMKGSGIHYHMLIASKIEYIATDPRRQDIAWVRVTRADGSVSEFENADNLLSDEEKASLETRVMDCMDCHNRPAHQFPTPMSSVNMALDQGAIPRDLPYIKVEAVRALSGHYDTTDDAMVGIANHLRHYYRENYPEVLDNGSEELTEAIRTVQSLYRRSIFPTMNARWSAYPNNIGHHYSPGCFRCHNDSMESDDGETVFTACNKCHLILAQGESVDEVNVDFRTGLEFEHPEDFDTIEEYEECVECHDGGGEVYE